MQQSLQHNQLYVNRCIEISIRALYKALCDKNDSHVTSTAANTNISKFRILKLF